MLKFALPALVGLEHRSWTSAERPVVEQHHVAAEQKFAGQRREVKGVVEGYLWLRHLYARTNEG
jgi:hypothetical protein